MPDTTQPIHYRGLYELLTESGFSVAGKDPPGTFLTQLSRSPAMRKTTEAGVYELDPDSPGRLRSQLANLQAELNAMTANPAPAGDLAEIRRQREAILSEMSRVEKALEEAVPVLGGEKGDGARARGAA